MLDGVRGEPMLVAQLNAGVDRRVNDDAAGERLVGVQRDLVGAAEIAGDLARSCVTCSARWPIRSCPRAELGAGEAARRQERRGQPVLRRASGMKALGHRAEHLAQADRLRRREAERPHHLLLGQPQAAAARRGGAEHARGAGDVPAAVVVRGIHGVADPALRFDAHHHRREKVASRDRAMFGEREERRDDRAGCPTAKKYLR